ncbi:MAG: hypothetical protein LBV69_11630 [Bacteroidales bacterium]|jgi:hypothetical protein|nr:hypothetical protein [Bacteroidales bacterium]
MKKNKISIISFFITLLFLLSFYGCRRDYTSDIDLESEDYNYFPFKKGDTVVYKNQQNDTINFLVIRKDYSKGTKYAPYNKSYSRRATISFILSSSKGVVYDLAGEIGFEAEYNKKRVNCNFIMFVRGADDYASFDIESAFYEPNNVPKAISLLSENNYIDSLGNKYLQYIKIVKDRGIIEFSLANDTWTLIE